MAFHVYSDDTKDAAYIYSLTNNDKWVFDGKCNAIITNCKYIDDKTGIGLNTDGYLCKTVDGGFTWYKVE